MPRSRSILIFTLSLVIILSACAPPAPQPSQQEIQQTIEIVVALTSLADNAAQESPPTEAAPSTAAPTSPPPSPEIATLEPPSSVVVVFMPGGLFDAAKRAEFYERIINPYMDYNNEQAALYPELASLVTITIETFDTPGYPYGAEAIYDNGGYEGWLISETAGLVDLWIPDCMNGPCPLSEEFISNYPNISATIQAQ